MPARSSVGAVRTDSPLDGARSRLISWLLLIREQTQRHIAFNAGALLSCEPHKCQAPKLGPLAVGIAHDDFLSDADQGQIAAPWLAIRVSVSRRWTVRHEGQRRR